MQEELIWRRTVEDGKGVSRSHRHAGRPTLACWGCPAATKDPVQPPLLGSWYYTVIPTLISPPAVLLFNAYTTGASFSLPLVFLLTVPLSRSKASR